MSKKHEYQPFKVDVSDAKICELCDLLEARTRRTDKITAELWQIAEEKPRFPNGYFVQVALPAPEGNKAELHLYLKVMWHCRSPSWNVRTPLDLSEFSPETIENVRAWIGELLRDYRCQPVRRQYWEDYLQKALKVLDQKPNPRVERQRKANAGFFGSW